jgi:hypothetical protein
MSNDLNVQSNLKKCIVKSCDGEAISVALCKCNLYKMNFVKMHEVEMANFMQIFTEGMVICV